MTANPEQSAEEKVRQRWPDARLVRIGNRKLGFAERVAIGVPYDGPLSKMFDYISGAVRTPNEAWLDAASRLEAEHE